MKQMKTVQADRRDFVKGMLGSLAAFSALPDALGEIASSTSVAEEQVQGAGDNAAPQYHIKFAVIGINHPHIYSMVGAVLRGGGDLVALYAKEPDLVATFTKRFPQAKLAGSEDEILNDPSIHLVLSSIVPQERAPLGIRVMRHGKDYMS